MNDSQRLFSALTDLAFFAVIAALGWHHVLGEPIVASLLSSYAAYRFGVGMGRTQAAVALSGWPPAGGSNPPGSGTSQSMRAVVPTLAPVTVPPVTPARDPSSMPRVLRTVQIENAWIESVFRAMGLGGWGST